MAEVKETLKKQSKKVQSGKRNFYDVDVPLTAVKISLYGGSIEEFEGKVIILDLTKSLRGKGLELRMKVKNLGNELTAFPISANITGSYIRRAIRRGTDYIEDSFIANCRDAVLKIKPFLIARRRVSRNIRKILRANARKFIEGYVKIRTVKELFSDIVASKLQRAMSVKLKKIYPLAMCEIRIFELIRDKSIDEISEDDKSKIIVKESINDSINNLNEDKVLIE